MRELNYRLVWQRRFAFIEAFTTANSWAPCSVAKLGEIRQMGCVESCMESGVCVRILGVTFGMIVEWRCSSFKTRWGNGRYGPLL